MNIIETHARARLRVTAREQYAKELYAEIDRATEAELARLFKEEGILPTCRMGCANCCGQHIIIHMLEAHVLAQHIKREFDIDDQVALKERIRKWNTWNDCRTYADASKAVVAEWRRSSGGALPPHYCPLLANGKCSIYPIRPIICRTHFVCSDPSACLSINDAGYTETAAVKLPSILAATASFSRQLQPKSRMEHADTIMLLPHALAIEMGWDFASMPN